MYQNIYTGTVVTTKITYIKKTNANGSSAYPYLKLFDTHNYCIGLIAYTQFQTYYRRIK